MNCDFSLFAKCFGWLEKWAVWLFILPCCCYKFCAHFQYLHIHEHMHTLTHTHTHPAQPNIEPNRYGPTAYRTLIKYIPFFFFVRHFSLISRCFSFTFLRPLVLFHRFVIRIDRCDGAFANVFAFALLCIFFCYLILYESICDSFKYNRINAEKNSNI